MRQITTVERVQRLVARANHLHRQWAHAHADFDTLITVGSDEEVEEASGRATRTYWTMRRAQQLLADTALTMSPDEFHRAVAEVPISRPAPRLDWDEIPF